MHIKSCFVPKDKSHITRHQELQHYKQTRKGVLLDYSEKVKASITSLYNKSSAAMFLKKYVSLNIYDQDLKKIFIIDHKQLEFNKNSGWALIVIPEKDDGNLSDREYFCIRDDLFDRIQSTYQDRNIMWKFISNETNEN